MRKTSCLVTALLLVGVIACVKSPTEPSDPCGTCAAPGTVPPTASAVTLAMTEGLRQASGSCPVTNTTVPDVTWWRCRMWVPDAVDTPNGRPHGACAAGMTDADGKTIHVNLGEGMPDVLLLVTWEARNSYWMRNGCGGQAYRRPLRN